MLPRKYRKMSIEERKCELLNDIRRSVDWVALFLIILLVVTCSKDAA